MVKLKGLHPHTATAKLMIIFDLPREKHAKTTLFVNIETEIANFESRRGDSGVKVSLERVGVSLERVEFSLE